MRSTFRSAVGEIDKLRGMRFYGDVEEARAVDEMLSVLSVLKLDIDGPPVPRTHDPRCNGNCIVGLLGRCVYETPRDVVAETIDTVWRGIEGAADKCYLADLALAYGEASKRCSELGNEIERAEDEADKAIGRRNYLRQTREATRTLMEKAKNALLVAAEKAAGRP